MPKKVEEKLKRQARRKFPKDKERQDAYVYGTLHEIEKKSGRKKK